VPQCHAGSEAELSFTLTYAAPEVVAAYEAGQHNHAVHPASDVWSLGIIAFELLTGERAFGPLTTVEEIMAHIAGRQPMPWEGPRREDLLRKLRAFKANVLECLHRDPARRPAMRTVVRGWEHVLRGATTTSLHVSA
jgi:eukaryotic-like serine/threonine-protein kinase